MMEKMDLFDEAEIVVKTTVKVRALGRVVGLDPEDIERYIDYHARKGAEKALHELFNGPKSLKELGFT